MFFNIKLYDASTEEQWEEEIYIKDHPDDWSLTEQDIIQEIERQLGPDEVLVDFRLMIESRY
jgi:hypothetical protein